MLASLDTSLGRLMSSCDSCNKRNGTFHNPAFVAKIIYTRTPIRRRLFRCAIPGYVILSFNVNRSFLTARP